MPHVQANSTYSLINFKGGTFLDISFSDNVSAVGFGYHIGANQLWTFLSAGGDRMFHIKSVGTGKYLSVSGGDMYNETRVFVADSPYTWRVEDHPGMGGGVKLSPEANPNFCLDLSGGRSAPGNPVFLWKRSDNYNQVWKLQMIEGGLRKAQGELQWTQEGTQAEFRGTQGDTATVVLSFSSSFRGSVRIGVEPA